MLTDSVILDSVNDFLIEHRRRFGEKWVLYEVPTQYTSYISHYLAMFETSEENFYNISPKLTAQERYDFSKFYVSRNSKIITFIPLTYYLRLIELGFTESLFPLRNYFKDGNYNSETRFLELKYLEVVNYLVEEGELSESGDEVIGDFYTRGTGQDNAEKKAIFFFENVPDYVLGAIEYIWKD
jgi:hypothetical protein